MHEHQHEALEHEGELSSGLAEEALAAAASLFADRGSQVRRVLDLGCGPGVGTAALVRTFPGATVVAVDGSPAMLERTAARAAGLGHAGRVETRLLDLDGDLRSLGGCDLAWAAMSIHHAYDEVATLRSLRSLIAPRGLLCVLERAEPLLVKCADELGRPGIWDRLAEAHRRWFEQMRPHLPGAMKAETYPTMLAEAGLDVVIDRPSTRIVGVPRDPMTHQFIAGVLRRTRTDLAAYAAEDDLAALRDFLDDTSTSPDRWEGAEVTVSRKVFIAATS
ncbi:MAG: class I SAM-dependent methyltransferase [Actinomycetota bacterium]|nr:class I SAM-dependent methyltransferase [Actinomycetota bacterium]